MSASNDQIMAEIIKLNSAVGSLESTVRSNHDHTVAVSGKADIIRGEIQAHVVDPNAHGVGGARRAHKDWAMWIAACIAAFDIILKVRGH